MESAFGIDHGEVSKAFKPPALGALKPLGSALKAGAQGMHGPAATAGQGRAMAVGGMGRKIGQFGMTNKKPLAIGGGAAAVGGVGGGLLGRRRQ